MGGFLSLVDALLRRLVYVGWMHYCLFIAFIALSDEPADAYSISPPKEGWDEIDKRNSDNIDTILLF